MIRAAILGVGLHGPGMAGWAAGRAVLTGAEPWEDTEAALPPPALLAPTERRRAGAAVRLALAVAEEASAASGLAAGAIPGVFATSNGDGAVLGALLETLASAAPQVSPTQFHNSVHNAGGGYWTIATSSRVPVTCLSCFDWTFAAGLLKAAAGVAVTAAPVLLCVYDLPMPELLAGVRPTRSSFGVGLVLAPPGTEGALAELGVAYRAAPPDAGVGAPRLPVLAALAARNPAARALPLLEALARAEADRGALAWDDGRLDWELRPCTPAPR